MPRPAARSGSERSGTVRRGAGASRRIGARVWSLVRVIVTVIVIVIVLVPRAAAANPSGSASGSVSDSGSGSGSESESGAYVELMGRGGAYGVGVEHQWRRVGVGVVASFLVVDEEQVTVVSPYLHVVLGAWGPHGWFAQIGPALTHVSIRSPVEEWDGVSDTGLGGVASSGYQWSGDRLFLRGSLSLAFGAGGVAPWGGGAIGVRF